MSEVKRLPDLSGRDIGKWISMGHADNWQIDGQLRRLDVNRPLEYVSEQTIAEDEDYYEIEGELSYEVRVGPWSAEFPAQIADEITVLVE